MKLFVNPNRRILPGLFLGAALLLAACGGGGTVGGTGAGAGPTATEPGLCANDFFPVVDGATWTYTSTGGPTGDSSWTSTISNVRADGFTFNNQFDELSTTQEWSCTPAGLAALQYGGGPEASLTAEALTGTFETTDAEGVSVPVHIAAGDTWTQTFTIHGDMQLSGQSATGDGNVSQTYTAIGNESVTVPAGSFDAMKIQVNMHFDLEITLNGVTVPVAFDSQATNWWAPGVGWVKSDSSATIEGGEPIITTTELQSYNIP